MAVLGALLGAMTLGPCSWHGAKGCVQTQLQNLARIRICFGMQLEPTWGQQTQENQPDSENEFRGSTPMAGKRVQRSWGGGGDGKYLLCINIGRPEIGMSVHSNSVNHS